MHAIEEVTHEEPPAMIPNDEASQIANEQYASFIQHRIAAARPDIVDVATPASEPAMTRGLDDEWREWVGRRSR